jgi:hypothetical protein
MNNDVELMGDEELLSVVAGTRSLFTESYTNLVPALREIKLRFLQARKEGKSYLGYTSFNKLCDEKLVISHRTIRKLVSDVKLQKHPENVPWYVKEFGENAVEKHSRICTELLEMLHKKFKDFNFHGWEPWRPTSDSDRKKWPPVENRYKVTLFLAKEQIEEVCLDKHERSVVEFK